MKRTTKDLEIPDGLSEKGRIAAEAIVAHLTAKERTNTGGCDTFYTPEEWKAMGEEYGLNALLIVVHDGGDVARFFNYDYESYSQIDGMTEALEKVGCYANQCTTWYSAVYAR